MTSQALNRPVDVLAQEIRRVDGNHSLGAGALAEALMPFLDREFIRRAAVSELIEAARNASAILGHAYHTQIRGELEHDAHDAYQRLDAAIDGMEAAL